MICICFAVSIGNIIMFCVVFCDLIFIELYYSNINVILSTLYVVICVPQVHLLTLVAHGIFRNGICNDQLLQVNLVSIFNFQKVYKAYRYNKQSLVQLMHVWKYLQFFVENVNTKQKFSSAGTFLQSVNVILQWEQGCPEEKNLEKLIQYVTERELISSAHTLVPLS